MQQAVADALPYLLDDVDPSLLALLGYSRKEMLKWCKYTGRNCAEPEFLDIQDPDAGTCFSFNWNASNHAERSGEKNGFNFKSLIKKFLKIFSQDFQCFCL